MTNDFANATTEELITHIVARDVAYGVEMARSIGHRMPIEYDVGFSKRIENLDQAGIRMRITLRLDDARHDVLVLVPYLDNRSTMREVDEKWHELMRRLRSASLTLAHVWLDRHPDARIPDPQIRGALAKLDVLKINDDAEAAWAKECLRKAQAARYQKVR